MGNIIQKELTRLLGIFLSYGKVVIGGMLLATLFLILFAGIQTNEIASNLVAAAFAALVTVSTGLSLFYQLKVKQMREKHELLMADARIKAAIQLLQELKDVNEHRPELADKVYAELVRVTNDRIIRSIDPTVGTLTLVLVELVEMVKKSLGLRVELAPPKRNEQGTEQAAR